MRNTLWMAIIVLLTLGGGCTWNLAENAQPVQKNGGHPKLSEQQMLIACSECHREVTPELYSSWYDSGHGMDNVKCYQCHGTFEDLRVEPDMARCAVCHARQFEKSAGGKSCWQCHPAHVFTVHKG